MKPKNYTILLRCVEEGTARGWNRAHQYLAKPGVETINEEMVAAIMDEISTYFEFEEIKE